ncbi:MAG: OmpA family protein [Candidatus Omnitrophica bacterium]|nr:OmpA family protein [Candidatus Omnitrophota bacterium]
MRRIIAGILVVLFVCVQGCALVLQRGRRSDIEKIEYLKSELDQLKGTRQLLEERLSQEIEDKQVRLEMAEKGLVITFVAEVLFDSGKAQLRPQSLPILDKVVRILREEVPQNNIGIEGHTDNQPIKYSGWKSNWELSAHRALSVLHYLEEQGISPNRMSAIGYGEFQPVASNDTDEGRQLNRRVEIVILPKTVKKAEEELLQPRQPAEYEQEELK